jgi:hypothetical protein
MDVRSRFATACPRKLRKEGSIATVSALTHSPDILSSEGIDAEGSFSCEVQLLKNNCRQNAGINTFVNLWIFIE